MSLRRSPSGVWSAFARPLSLVVLGATSLLVGCADPEVDDVDDDAGESKDLSQPLQGGGSSGFLPLLPLRRTFTGDSGGLDQCNAIAAGPGDSMVVTGEVRRLVQGYNAWNRAYDATGATLWTKEIQTPTEGNDRGSDVVALSDGTSVVAGKWYSGSGTQQNYFLTKLSSQGATQWWRESALAGNDMYLGVARDGAGAWLAAGSQPDGGGVAQAWIRKLSSDGSAETWSIVRNGSAAGADAANKIGVDSGDNVIAVGYESNAGTGRDGWIAKYSSAGALVWNLSLSTSGNNDEITDVAVASDDALFVAGKLDTSSTLRAYTPAGALLWHITAPDGITWRGVAVDPADNVLVTGSLGADLIVRKYTSAGALVWQRTWPGAKGNSVAADSLGRVLVCGAENAADGGTDGLVLRYLPW